MASGPRWNCGARGWPGPSCRHQSADRVSGVAGAWRTGADWNSLVMSLSARVVWLDSTGGRSAAVSAAACSAFFFSASSALAVDLFVDEGMIEAGDRLEVDILVRIDHQPLPNHRRQRAAGHVVGRGEVVIAEPHGSRVVACKADIPGVAVRLRCAGLAGRNDIGKRSAPRRAHHRHRRQHGVHGFQRLLREHTARRRRILGEIVNHLAGTGDELGDAMPGADKAVLGEHAKACRLVHHGHARCAEHHRLVRFERRFDAHGFRHRLDRLDAEIILGQPHRHGVDRFGHRRDQRDLAGPSVIVIVRRPGTPGDRRRRKRRSPA